MLPTQKAKIKGLVSCKTFVTANNAAAEKRRDLVHRKLEETGEAIARVKLAFGGGESGEEAYKKFFNLDERNLMSKLVGLRNIVSHQYDNINDEVIYEGLLDLQETKNKLIVMQKKCELFQKTEKPEDL